MEKICYSAHHKLILVLQVAVWLAAIGFFYTSWSGNMLYAMNAEYFFQAVIVLSLLTFGISKWSCRYSCSQMSGGSMMGMGNKSMICDHADSCNCGHACNNGGRCR